MSQKDRQRYHLLKMVTGGRFTLNQASSVVDISYRHANRLKRELLSEGARGLVKGGFQNNLRAHKKGDTLFVCQDSHDLMHPGLYTPESLFDHQSKKKGGCS